jgi:hypothetical protein
MRDFKGMKRQRGRNRSSGSQGNQGKPQQNANRAFESNGPDNVKIRGNAQHVFERYQQLARDASSAGDRVLAENYLQHAEHYFRVIRAVQPNRPTADIIGRETFSSGFDIDFEDESGINADPEPEVVETNTEESGDQRPRDNNNNNNNNGPRQDRYERPRDDRYERPRDDQQQRDRPRDGQQRDDRPRDGQQRDDRPREGQQRDERPRDDRPRDGQQQRDRNFNRDRDRNFNRDDRPQRDRPFNREDRPAEAAVAAEAPAPAPAPVEAPAPVAAAPQRPARMLRSQDGDQSHAPAFLQPREPRPETVADDGEAKPKVRRKRTPAKTEEV